MLFIGQILPVLVLAVVVKWLFTSHSVYVCQCDTAVLYCSLECNLHNFQSAKTQQKFPQRSVFSFMILPFVVILKLITR